jgi:hypothetical protein
MELEKYEYASPPLPGSGLSAATVTTQAWYNVRPLQRLSALYSILLTLFIIAVLLLGALVFSADAHVSDCSGGGVGWGGGWRRRVHGRDARLTYLRVVCLRAPGVWRAGAGAAAAGEYDRVRGARRAGPHRRRRGHRGAGVR